MEDISIPIILFRLFMKLLALNEKFNLPLGRYLRKM